MNRILLAGICILLAGCDSSPSIRTQPSPIQAENIPTPGAENATAPTPFQPALPTLPFPTPEGFDPPVSTPYELTIWVHPTLETDLPPFLTASLSRETAILTIDLAENQEPVFATRTYALAAPFHAIEDGITSTELNRLWTEDSSTLAMSPETAALLQNAWEPGGADAVVVPATELVEAAWNSGRFAILPFHQLGPKWKVLAVDGRSPLHKDFDPEGDPLTFHFALQGDPRIVEALNALFGPDTPAPLTQKTNRDPGKLTTVVLTGVTALVRATAFTMEQRGLTYPARDIGGWLRDADILHISNEVPFAEDCPPPNPLQVGVRFCSDEKYITLLEDIGTDIVELTGDHFHDWGAAAMLFTLDLYAERGWPVYGGGATYDEGKQAVLFERNGTRIAFIGCNGKGPVFARASASDPGSVECNMDWMTSETSRLTKAGYQVIATFQHNEYYTYAVTEPIKRDFRAVADAGAVIVSGSQAHHPHGFEFRENALIHYGLGNLFFDQLGINPGTEQAFIDRHVFYDGRYLGVELLTIRFEDFARARPMTIDERMNLLRLVFEASIW